MELMDRFQSIHPRNPKDLHAHNADPLHSIWGPRSHNADPYILYGVHACVLRVSSLCWRWLSIPDAPTTYPMLPLLSLMSVSAPLLRSRLRHSTFPCSAAWCIADILQRLSITINNSFNYLPCDIISAKLSTAKPIYLPKRMLTSMDARRI